METIGRRSFLESSTRTVVALSAGLGTLAARRPVRAVAASDKVVLGTIGLGGRGSRLTRDFAERADCEIAALCDTDERRGGDVKDDLAARKGRAPAKVNDYRRVLEDKSVDAIVVATPDHWHGLLTVYGCQAGKHVYVEKPASHNIWEGRKMVEASRKYGRVVQVGTQNRSAPYCLEALELVRSGAIGKIHLCKVFNLKSGGPFRLPKDGPVPPGVDYDTWLGPCPLRPFNPSHFHGGWGYWWNYGGGDLGNDTIHQLDIARWFINKPYPRSVHSTGGNFAYHDEREVPDTQVATFEYDDMVLTIDLTQWAPYMEKTNNQIRTGDSFPRWMQNATRIEFYGSKCLMVLGRHGGGWQVFTNGGQVVKERYGRFPDATHKEDFIQSIRSGRLPSADILEGHRSAALVHMANISYRLGGRKLQFDSESETFDDSEANRLVKREFREPYTIPEEV